MDIQTLIDKAGGTPQQLGDLLGVARTTVLDWRRTGCIPGTRVRHISAALGIPVTDLIGLVGAPRTPGRSADVSCSMIQPRSVEIRCQYETDVKP